MSVLEKRTNGHYPRCPPPAQCIHSAIDTIPFKMHGGFTPCGVLSSVVLGIASDARYIHGKEQGEVFEIVQSFI